VLQLSTGLNMRHHPTRYYFGSVDISHLREFLYINVVVWRVHVSLLAFLAALALPLLWSAVFVTWCLHRRKARARIMCGQCDTCGYSLIGHGNDVCPECGESQGARLQRLEQDAPYADRRASVVVLLCGAALLLISTTVASMR
jgi:hypothetical protein